MWKGLITTATVRKLLDIFLKEGIASRGCNHYHYPSKFELRGAHTVDASGRLYVIK